MPKTLTMPEQQQQSRFTVEEYAGADGERLRYGKLTSTTSPEVGRPLVFIPGLGGSVKGALPFLELLLPHYNPIYAPDLRSFGLNHYGEGKPPLRHINVIRGDLSAFFDHLSNHLALPEPVDLAGISLGGILATHLVADHPERYSRLLLLAPAFKAHTRSFPLTYKVKSIIGRLVQGHRHATALPYGVEALTRNAAILEDPQYKNPPPMPLTIDFLLSVEKLGDGAFKKTAQLTVPTKIVVPGNDVVCDPVAMRAAYYRIPDTTPKLLREYDDFYHDLLFEEGYPQIAQEILDWCKDCP